MVQTAGKTKRSRVMYNFIKKRMSIGNSTERNGQFGIILDLHTHT